MIGENGMRCPNCQKESPQGSRFCSFCGSEMTQEKPKKNNNLQRIVLLAICVVGMVLTVILFSGNNKKSAEMPTESVSFHAEEVNATDASIEPVMKDIVPTGLDNTENIQQEDVKTGSVVGIWRCTLDLDGMSTNEICFEENGTVTIRDYDGNEENVGHTWHAAEGTWQIVGWGGNNRYWIELQLSAVDIADLEDIGEATEYTARIRMDIDDENALFRLVEGEYFGIYYNQTYAMSQCVEAGLHGERKPNTKHAVKIKVTVDDDNFMMSAIEDGEDVYILYDQWYERNR